MVTTLPALLQRQSQRLGPRVALRFRRRGLYHDITWHDYAAAASACAAALVQAGVAVGDRVATLAENRVEWLIADLATLMVGATTVPLHATLSARQIQYQLANAGVRWLFLSRRDQYDKLAQIRAELPDLVRAVVFDGPVGGDLSWPGFLQRGRSAGPQVAAEVQCRLERLTLDDLATIMYTSGTTGQPKGVMLTHGNLLSNATALDETSPLPTDAHFFNWLPFSHIYARTVDVYATLVAGVTLCLAESPETVVVNLAEIQPTHMSGVPRFYEKVYAVTHSGDPVQSARRLRSIFGPRIDWLSSGGAPLSPAVARAFQAAGLLLLQGYGLTETSPVITFNRKDRFKVESVGQALPGVEVRIADDGEIMTRGPHVMKGYWKDAEATAAALQDGWFSTGDLGQLDADGFLTITGRKKDLLVLSNGKKVVPNHIEGLLLADPCIEQAVVCGEGRNFLTALLVPNWALVRQSLPLDSETDEMLARDPRIETFLTERVRRALTEVSIPEQVRRFVIVPRPFSIAADEMTVSMKLRRNVIVAHHRDALDALYHHDGDSLS